MPPARGPQEIVYSTEILSKEDSSKEKWNLIRLIPRIAVEKRQCLKWLAQRRMIKNSVICDKCDKYCSLQKDDRNIDGYRWICTCSSTYSVRKKSVFMKSHLELEKCVLMVYYWADLTSEKKASRELELSSESSWYYHCYEVCLTYLLEHSECIGGIDFTDGEAIPKIVEIDKNRLVPLSHGQWLFGGLERESNKSFLIKLAHRDERTIESIIVEWILPGTHVISSDVDDYSNISFYNGGIYTHEVFSCADYSARTNNQRGNYLWDKAYRMFQYSFNTSTELFDNYLVEYIWRSKFKANTFSNILFQLVYENVNVI